MKGRHYTELKKIDHLFLIDIGRPSPRAKLEIEKLKLQFKDKEIDFEDEDAELGLRFADRIVTNHHD